MAVASLRLVDVYAEPGRDPRGRFVSFAYAALMDGLREPVAVDEALSEPSRLAFDHHRIIHDALRAIT